MFSLSLHGVLEGEVNEGIIGQHVCVALCAGRGPQENVFLTSIPGYSDKDGPETIC